MTARTVVGFVEFPNGAGVPCVGARVVASLFSGGELAYGTANDVAVGAVATLTDAEGAWSLSLEPNSNITPTGTVWSISITPPDRSPTSFYIEVPDTTGPHDVTDLLTDEPGALPSRALAAHAALEVAHGANGAIVGASDVGSVFQRPNLIDVRDYGATPGGVVDATSAIQSAVTAAAAGDVVTGAGLTFLVTSIALKSDLTFERFALLTKPGATDFVSPVTVGAYDSDTVRSNITIRHVHVNGQRTQQTSIGASEDGGRHGFRLIGYIEDLVMSDCSATLCASDGLCIYSGTGVTRNPTEGIKKRLTFERCSFTHNRRHGVSIDSLEASVFRDCVFSNNGLDVGVADGGLGATLLGDLYGNGVDVEEYAVGTYESDLTFERCVGLDNARAAILFYAGPNRADDAQWVVRPRFRLSGCLLGEGVDESGDGYAVEFTPAAANNALGWYYTDIKIVGCDLLGALSLRSVRSTTIVGSMITTSSQHAGNLDTVESVRVMGCDLRGKSFLGGGDALTVVATS